ncbi:MAG: OsmC family peroxiredoxin [Candidatus Thorarchaeota archaeon]|nr:OsmC family peroxiredoxin [Candidatus Thorarchaeota archaeon]
MKTMGNSTFTAHLTKTEVPQIHTITLGGYQSTAVCPPPMTKECPGTTSPHQLFLASIGACVNLVFEIALQKARVDLLDLHSEIVGHYETDDKSGESRFTTIEIHTRATVPKDVDEKKIQRLFDVAHKNCPIGNCLIGSCVKLVTELVVSYR